MGEIQRLGRYQVTGVLGRGSMGVVYQGFDPLIERDVALKVIRIPPWMSEEEVQEYRERFFREAKAAGRLQHPHIVTVYDIGTDDRTSIPFIVMELVRGETLKNRIQREGCLPWQTMVEILRQVAEALHFAHRSGIIHRDIKPSNIMVTATGLVKITDFGIAHMPASELTRTGQLLGSPSYMSPEQIIGERVTYRTDLFSLGVVLFESLTGQKPFQGDTFSQITFKIVHEPPPDLRSLRPDLPEPLIRLIERLLSKDPGGRFETAGAIVTYIRQHLSPSPPTPEEEPPVLEPLEEAIPLEGTPGTAHPPAASPIHGLETAQITTGPWANLLEGLKFFVRWGFPLLLLIIPFGWWAMSRRLPPPGPPSPPPAAASNRPTLPATTPQDRLALSSPREEPCTVRFAVFHKYPVVDIQAWVDETLVFKKRFYGRVRRFAVLKIVERSVASGAFPLDQGEHTITLWVRGEGEDRKHTQAVRCDEPREIPIRIETSPP